MDINKGVVDDKNEAPFRSSHSNWDHIPAAMTTKFNN